MFISSQLLASASYLNRRQVVPRHCCALHRRSCSSGTVLPPIYSQILRSQLPRFLAMLPVSSPTIRLPLIGAVLTTLIFCLGCSLLAPSLLVFASLPSRRLSPCRAFSCCRVCRCLVAHHDHGETPFTNGCLQTRTSLHLWLSVASISHPCYQAAHEHSVVSVLNYCGVKLVPIFSGTGRDLSRQRISM